MPERPPLLSVTVGDADEYPYQHFACHWAGRCVLSSYGGLGSGIQQANSVSESISGSESAVIQHFSGQRLCWAHRTKSTSAGHCSLAWSTTRIRWPSFGAVSIDCHCPDEVGSCCWYMGKCASLVSKAGHIRRAPTARFSTSADSSCIVRMA